MRFIILGLYMLYKYMVIKSKSAENLYKTYIIYILALLGEEAYKNFNRTARFLKFNT
jgi:hypothetical protein